MTAPDPSPADVGRQLLERREDLDLTQQELAQRIGISARTVSAVERGVNQITKSRRGDWERALELKPGTISRAYRDGSRLEPAEPYAHISDVRITTTRAPAEDEDDEDPKMKRAAALLAEASALLEEIRRERREGA